jgi:two-component system, NtrC family, sensor histidine kinase PilS
LLRRAPAARRELKVAAAQDDAPQPALGGELTADSAFARLWRGFMSARVAIALVLLALESTMVTLGPATNLSPWLIVLCVTYLAATLAVRVFTRPLPPGRTFDPQWVSTIGVDLLAFSTLQFLQAGGISYLPLFALPVLMGSVLGSALLALATAAGVGLLLLTDAWVLALRVPSETTTHFLQAGLSGFGYFAVAFLANQLAARLAREEEAARSGQRAARVQAQVNELVIETLADGVLVVDAQGTVQTANPAARALLGMVPGAGPAAFALTDGPAWQPLVALSQRTFSLGTAQIGDVALKDAAGSAQRMHVRTRLTPSQGSDVESLCVMFLEDLRELEARLRTEKLAAMGRMSAAVAHEIRNPLAAIAQANALMEEDLREPALKQLSSLVRKNAQRLAQIVDEVLDISRVQQASATPQLLELDATVAATCSDWAMQTRSGSRLQLTLSAPAARVPFEADHLRRVLVNLLDNALRHAGDKPDSIRVATSAQQADVALRVWSDGAPLESSVQRHLFEPFFSSESRSSGLGLYICRELCERHGAAIGYRRVVAGTASNAREGNEFFVGFRPGTGPYADAASFDTMAV